MNEPISTQSADVATVLSLEPSLKDQTALERIFTGSNWPLCPGLKWKLKGTATVRSALAAIRRTPVPLVLCGCDVQPDAWKEMLEQFPILAEPPFLIVTSRLADERLWVEALNLGAYDVLAKPFDRTEVTRAVNSACLRWQGQHGFGTRATQSNAGVFQPHRSRRRHAVLRAEEGVLNVLP